MAQDDYRSRITTAPGGIGTLQLGPQAYIDPRDQRYVHDAYQWFLNQQGGGEGAAPGGVAVAQDPTTMIPQTGGEGITAASAAQNMGGAQNPLTQIPVGQTQTVKQLMTSPEAYNIPGQMPKTPVSGAWGPQDYLQPEPFVQDPTGMIPQLGSQEDPAWWESARDKFIETGQDVGGIFKDLAAKGIDVGKMAGSAIMNMIAPGLGFVTQLPISSASGAQQDLVKDQLVDSGVVLDDIGRIVQTGDYNTPENVMAGYAPGQTGLQIGDLKIGGGTVQHSAAERINDIQNTIDNLDENWSQLKASDPEAFEAKKQNLIDRQEALKEFINMGAAEAAGGVRLEDWDPENKIAGEVVYGTDYFPELGQEDTAPVTIEKTYKEKAEEAWKDIKTIDTIAGNTIYGNENIGFFPSPGEAQAALEAYAAEADQAEAGTETAVTGVEGPPSILSPEIYQDPIMDIADERRALQEELEAYRDPIMDMEPAESVDLADIEGKDSRIVPEEYETEGYPWLDYQDPIMDMAAEQEAAAAVEAAIQEQASKDLGQSLHGGAEDNQGMDQGGFDPGGGFVDQGGQGEFGGAPSGPSGPSAPSGSTAAGGPTYGPHGGASYGPHGGGGGGGGSSGCFLKGTQVTMADGSTKAIEQVDLGDNVAKGGKVFATGKFLVENLHDYKGIKVSGSHMVSEDGNWVRVEDSKHGKALGDDEHTVYVFGAENRRILINDILFTDYFEVNEQEKLSEGDKFFDNWKIHAKVDSDNNVNVLNAN